MLPKLPEKSLLITQLRTFDMYILRYTMTALFVAWLSIVSDVEATEWTVDKAKSTLGFSVDTSLVLIEVRFNSYETHIFFNRGELENVEVVAEVDIASAEVHTSRQSGDLTVAILSPAWMSAVQYPKAVFTSTAARKVSGNAFELDGTLELHGIKKEVTIPFTLEVDGNTAHAVGEAELTRTDFNIGQGSFAEPDKVSLEVTVMFDLVANKRFMESRSQRPDFELLRGRPIEQDCWNLPFGLNHIFGLFGSGC